MNADLITAYAHTYKPGDRTVIAYSFESGEEVTIPIAEDNTAIDEARLLVSYGCSNRVKVSVKIYTCVLSCN